MLSEIHHDELQHEVLRKHFDANETMFLERELTQLRAKIYEVVYPELMARSFAPKASDISSSAETYSYKVITPVGNAGWVAAGGDDLPRVDAHAKEVLGKVRSLGASYSWNLVELREAARNNVPLAFYKAKIARDIVERQIDEVLAFGSIRDQDGGFTDVGLAGLVNNALVVSNTVLAGSFWTNPTPLAPATILDELNGLANSVFSASKQAFEADTILLPSAHYKKIEQTPYSANESDSILTVFLKNNRAIKQVVPWYNLDTAGATSGPRAVAYKKDASVLEAVIPQEFETLPPEARGLRFIVNCHARSGGVKIYQPIAMKYLDFATS